MRRLLFIPPKYTTPLLHLLIWGGWMLVPLIFIPSEVERDAHLYFRILSSFVLLATLFYVNYYLLIHRLLFRERMVFFFLVNIALLTGFIFLADLSREMVKAYYDSGLQQAPHKRPPVILHLVPYIFIISVSVAIRTTQRWYFSERQRKMLENENLRSELNNLKMQLNPHFFFNTLNNIYALIRISPDRAQKAVHDLGRLMRYHLYDTQSDKVPLEGEIEFLKNFIALMQLRLGNNITVSTDFNVENQQLKVPPLLFIAVVENAFKHGVHPTDDCRISFRLFQNDEVLSFESVNSNHPSTEAKAGIGLGNLKKRLELLYPECHTIQSGVRDAHFYLKMEIKL